MVSIFISYSRTDESFARQLALDLDRLGADIWLDVDDIPAGVKWSTAIQQGLDICDLMIVILSPASAASVNVEDEWQYYLDQHKPIIPILYLPTKIHFQLSRIQYVNFHDQPYDKALRQLHGELERKGILLNPIPGGSAPIPAQQTPLPTSPHIIIPSAPATTSRPARRPLLFAGVGVLLIALALLGILARNALGGSHLATDTPIAQKQSLACNSNGIVRVATDASSPPLESIDTGSGIAVGFDIDLLAAIAKSQGFDVNVKNENFDTIFAKLAQGDYDLVISAATITDERQKTVNFSNPYFLSGQSITIRKDDMSKYKALADLEGLKIGVEKNTTGEDYANKNIKNAKVSSYTLADAVQALMNKDVDALIIDMPVALNIVTTQPNLKLAVIKGDLTSEQYGIAVRKDCPDLLKAVNDGLRAVIKEGTYNTLYRHYFSEDAPPEFKP